MRVHNAAVRVSAEGQPEGHAPVVVIPVEPVAVVEVAIALRGLRHRLMGLVDAVVVEGSDHPGLRGVVAVGPARTIDRQAGAGKLRARQATLGRRSGAVERQRDGTQHRRCIRGVGP
ncbi:MAG: hypothetical protein ACK56I_02105, partial [bacterium]